MLFIKKHLKKLSFLALSLLLFANFGLPAFFKGATASQLTTRSLTLSSSSPAGSNATTTYTFVFTPIAATVLKSFAMQACTTAVGTCTTPTGFSVSAGPTTISQPTAGCGDTSGWSVSNATAGELRMKKTGATAAPGGGACTLVWQLVQNPTSTNTAFFMRITTYSDDAWTTAVDTGTTASATTITNLQVNAAVAEILNFCVGNTAVDNSTSSVAADCTGFSGTSVNLGTLDSTKVNVTPVSTNCSAGDCSKNGAAMVRSNAVNGTVIYYTSVAQSGTNHTRDLRIVGDTCEATADNTTTSVTDSCFNQSPTQGTISAGTEKWGLTVAGVNCGSSSSYGSCTGTADSHLARTANYDGNGGTTYTSESDQSVTGTTTNGYAWDEGGTAVSLASSAAAGTKQVDDEALILKFAATPSITTPFGSYTAKADFVAVSTY